MNRVLDLMAKTAYTWNGALSYSTTSFDKLGACLDYFSKAGTYVARPQTAVDADMSRIFNDDEQTALRIVFGVRLISRKPNVDGIEDAQTGYGRRDEFARAIIWLHNNRPELLYRNLHLIPLFGSWKDFVNEPLIDVLDRERVYHLFSENLGDNLLRKYLPQIRSKKNSRSDRDRKRIGWAIGLCKYLDISHAEYRHLKSDGLGHIWQKQMSSGKFDDINFNGIPGKAMTLISSGKGRDGKNVWERHNQVERLLEWLKSQNKVKFTGYPYELMRVALKNPNTLQKLLYNLQFESMIEPMRGHALGNVLAAIDTSGSMTCTVAPPDIRAIDICLSMGVVFSSLNTGYFKNVVASFNDRSTVQRLTGSFVERCQQIGQNRGWGSTNFQSLIDLLVSIRQENPNIPIEEYPETILVLSDMQFNPTGHYSYYNDVKVDSKSLGTNYEVARKKLQSVGLGDVRIIWWHLNGSQTTDFPAQMNDKGCYMVSGFDPNALKGLMGLNQDRKDFVAKERVEETPLDGMVNFLTQPIFSLLE